MNRAKHKPPPDGEALQVTSPGKVFLAGEYSVLAGQWSVVASVGVHATARLVSEQGRGHRWSEFTRAILREADPSVAARLKRRRQKISLDLSAFYDGKTKFGVGSSAAGTAAVMGLVQVLEQGRIGRRDVLARRCASVHRALQAGLGSGADAAACARGGVIRFRKPATLRPVRLPTWLEPVAVVLGRGGRTTRVLERHARLVEAKEYNTLLNLEVFAESAQHIMGGLEDRSWYSLRLGVNLMSAAYEELADLLGAELVTGHDRKVMRMARRLGGISRPSGAGGGDLHIAYFRESEAAHRFRKWTASQGWRAIPVHPDPLGTHLTNLSTK